MDGKGVNFEFGYPHFYGAVNYRWPNSPGKREEDLKRKYGELKEPLLEKLRGYYRTFLDKEPENGVPYVHANENGLTFHLLNGGKWIEIGGQNHGADLVGEHNLDYSVNRAIAFNLGADTLELLDEGILAPRVRVQGGKYSLIYPLPHPLNLIPNSQELNERLFGRLLEVVRVKPSVEIRADSRYQSVKTSIGEIVIRDGICISDNLKHGNSAVMSWVIARMMNLCQPD